MKKFIRKLRRWWYKFTDDYQLLSLKCTLVLILTLIGMRFTN